MPLFTVSDRPTLPAIITAARAGSLRHAQTMFKAGGFDACVDDPSVLAVKGRLIKDEALRAPPADHATLFALAADAYGAACALSPQPYTMINQASLSLLAGRRGVAVHLATQLLSWLATDGSIAETPYYLAATRAEAHLLCGDVAAADRALTEAITHDPDGWTDHASTLRQLGLIARALGIDPAWLDCHRPPRSLNFAGHLGVGMNDAAVLRDQVSTFLTEMNIGFGYGALAAGADIVIAEALLAHGAELHVMLPTQVDDFVRQSVMPFAPVWLQRFEHCLAHATNVQCVTSMSGSYEPLATKLAADVAMGASVLNARALESSAAQLLVIDDGPGPFGTGLGTAYLGERWINGGAQQCIRVPRSEGVVASGLKIEREGRKDLRLAAILMISFDGLDALDEGAFAAAIGSVLEPFRAAAAAIVPQPDLTLPTGNARIAAFADPDAAWAFARAVLALPPTALPLRLSGHYALAHWLTEPPALVGHGVTQLASIAASALPGVFTVSETLASALFVNGADDIIAEHIGEVGSIRLFAVTGRSASV